MFYSDKFFNVIYLSYILLINYWFYEYKYPISSFSWFKCYWNYSWIVCFKYESIRLSHILTYPLKASYYSLNSLLYYWTLLFKSLLSILTFSYNLIITLYFSYYYLSILSYLLSFLSLHYSYLLFIWLNSLNEFKMTIIELSSLCYFLPLILSSLFFVYLLKLDYMPILLLFCIFGSYGEKQFSSIWIEV